MSAQKDVRPYHADDPDRGKEAADAVAAVLRHAADRDEASGRRSQLRKQPRWMLPIGINLAVLALYLLVAPPRFVIVDPIDAPDVAAQTRSAETAMWFAANAVQAFASQNGGRLPASLAELTENKLPAHADYRVRGDTFQIVLTVGDRQLIYDSANPDPSFGSAVAAGMARSGG